MIQTEIEQGCVMPDDFFIDNIEAIFSDDSRYQTDVVLSLIDLGHGFRNSIIEMIKWRWLDTPRTSSMPFESESCWCYCCVDIYNVHFSCFQMTHTSALQAMLKDNSKEKGVMLSSIIDSDFLKLNGFPCTADHSTRAKKRFINFVIHYWGQLAYIFENSDNYSPE